jgi:hypothetical protein
VPDHPPADHSTSPVVTKLGYDTASCLFADPVTGLRVETVDATGTVIHWSRLPGEDFWAADALVRGGHYPVFVNGNGARYLRLRIAPPQVAAILDAAVAKAGLMLAPEDNRAATDPSIRDPDGNAR